MSEKYTIGIDLGGTNIKCAVCDESVMPLVRLSIETQADRGCEHVLERMVLLVDELLAKASLARSDILGIGLGAPGPISYADGMILNAPNLPGWVNIPLRQRFADATKLPIVLENDANAAAYGEFVSGAGQDVHSMVMLTLGTGIGSGIILNDVLCRGCDGSAAEIGHIVLVPNGRPCPCGQEGCFERYASAQAVAERYDEAVRNSETSSPESIGGLSESMDAQDVLRAIEAGDSLATRVWDETCRYLALGCINIEHILGPELIVLGGGLANAGRRLLDPVRAYFRTLRWKMTHPALEISLAALGLEAGTIGAAALARTCLACSGRPP